MISPSSLCVLIARKNLSEKHFRILYLIVFLISIAVPLFAPLGELIVWYCGNLTFAVSAIIAVEFSIIMSGF